MTYKLHVTWNLMNLIKHEIAEQVLAEGYLQTQ